jgi:serine/threonine protein kinase/Tol biopolymer transport system component
MIRFGPFELDVRAAELRKHGTRVRLHEQPFRILVMLLGRPGEVVLREEIRKALWPNDTIVEFDSGINAAIQRLRNSLGDSADNPRYVETLARRGYRFIGTVLLPGTDSPEPEPPAAQPEAPPEPDPGDLSGRTLSHFRVVRKLGAGGMGVVYLADDLKLGRQVALKFLRQSEDESSPQMRERLRERFEREARAASALSHPNICTVHGVEELARQPAIVMELVEGETLEARLAKGALAPAKALPLAIQLASALDAAHRKGIVHRDLKPANIMLTKSGLKVLDFGLAKFGLAKFDPANVDLVETAQKVPRGEETAAQVTHAGAVMGTWQYMSPEQAQGKVADARSDIFSYGAVLLEMVTGRRSFSGESAAELMEAIMTKDPLEEAHVSALLSPGLKGILRHCLEKNPEDRFQSARDLAFALESLAGPSELPAAPPARHGAWLPRFAGGAAAVATVATLGLMGISFLYFGEKPPVPPAPLRFRIEPPEKVALDPCCQAISPDGRKLAFTTGGRLWVHFLESGESRELASATRAPFWSPDSRFIGYTDSGNLEKIAASGGPPEILADWRGNWFQGGAWIQDDLLLAVTRAGIVKVSARGGPAVPVTRTDPAAGNNHIAPSVLPDRRHFLYFRLGEAGTYLGAVDARPEQQSPNPLVHSSWQAEYVPSVDGRSGYLLFLRDSTLMAQPFDDRRLELTGQAVPVAEQVDDNTGGAGGYADFSASANALVFRRKTPSDQQLTWYNRQGTSLGTLGEPGAFAHTLGLSPNGKRLAIGRKSGTASIWLWDLTHGGSGTRFTFNSSQDVDPVWSPDGSRIVFSSGSTGKPNNLYQKLSSGAKAEELLLESGEDKYPTSWSPDGRLLLYSSLNLRGANGIWVLPLEGGRKPVPFLVGEFDESSAYFSPDGRWVAYQSNESGQTEVYVRSFSLNSAGTAVERGGKWQISTGSGLQPRWRADGRELYYRSPEGGVMAVDIATSPVFRAGTPHPVGPAFDARQLKLWAVHPDGRFLLAPPVRDAPQAYTVVLNWQSGLKR